MHQYKSVYMYSIFRTILGVHKNVMYQYKNILHSLFARILCSHGLQVKYIICLFRHMYLFYLTVYMFICRFAYIYLFIYWYSFTSLRNLTLTYYVVVFYKLIFGENSRDRKFFEG